MKLNYNLIPPNPNYSPIFPPFITPVYYNYLVSVHDAIIKLENGKFIEIQIKARSSTVKTGDSALFAALTHELRENYWFVFYSERLDKIWIMSSEEFIQESNQNKNGKNIGKRSIWFNGTRTINKETGEKQEYVHQRFNRYICENQDFEMFKNLGKTTPQ